ncbi:hypothetical protein CICLE_v10004866mg [Citrus x clementina]|uniref:Uncharacterized protein n=1 Tax=Citrus clementina TaxID=85681 RepID=V4S0B4_CITCL|nr:hypothetical protein CICLE_v10004866mg [Citrus x clementina]
MAEERKLSSMKRAATANDLHPTVGMFTRSKSEMCLHRNRSGRVRFDSFPLPVSEKRRRTALRQDSSSSVDGGDDDVSCILIKDLRTKRVFSKRFPMNSFFEPKKVEEGSVEESAQSTPPDIDFFVDTKVAEEDGNPNVGSVPEKQSNEIDQKNSRIKSFLRPCSRVKLFKAPGSVSYRRLLPFLMDISEENSADASSNDQEINSKLLKDVNESLNPLNKQQEQDVHFEQDISDTGRKLESGPEIMDINHEIILSGTQLRPHSTSGSFWTKDDKEASSPPSSLSIEEDCSNPAIEVSDDAKPIEADSLHQKSSLHATSFCLNTSAPVFKKGILKRNPRGCRGLCTCLNCSSFRLHAEKAFEFSRNQMQDAEEVCLDLIKELSYIRNMLEKSPFSTDGHALVSGSQIKEVCKRASEVEALAQNRLSEMNFDLNIHCRVTHSSCFL